MRIGIKVGIGLAVIWSLYWMAASFGTRQAISGWMAAQQARGWQAEAATITGSGYPLRIITQLDSPALADPATGVAWRSPALTFDSPAIWPGHIGLQFADGAQRLSYFDQTYIWDTTALQADLHLMPGFALTLDKMSARSAGWQLRAADEDAPLLAADSLTLAMSATEDANNTYRLRAGADALTPGQVLRRMAGIGADMPEHFDQLEMDMTIRFDRPWDRGALETRRPQPRRIDLALAEAAWGPLGLSAAGAIDIDSEGQPEGQISIRAENWQDMLTLVERAGALPPGGRDRAERLLSLLAGLSGRPETLDLRLNITNGFVAVGPLPLGPAPRILLR